LAFKNHHLRFLDAKPFGTTISTVVRFGRPFWPKEVTMSKKSHMSHDQKRKAKLAKRASLAPKPSPLASTGRKYKNDEFVPVWFQTELAIHETAVVTDYKLTDAMVVTALEKLINVLLRGEAPALPTVEVAQIVVGEEVEFLVSNIRRQWGIMEQEGTHVTQEDLIGVLRSLLGSIAQRRLMNPGPRSYLMFLKGFMKKQGVSVRVMDE